MERNGDIYISPNHKKDEYRSLNLSLSSDPTTWETALDIFEDRIAGRFVNQITTLSNNINSNGFAIMALNCLLIETLLQFKLGTDETPSYNRDHYANFLTSEFPFVFDSQRKARRFYSDIRCGILHSAQTKDKSRLTCDTHYVINLRNGIFSVSVYEFSIMLQQYLAGYIQKLRNPSEIVLRQNFIAKMDLVCRL